MKSIYFEGDRGSRLNKCSYVLIYELPKFKLFKISKPEPINYYDWYYGTWWIDITFFGKVYSFRNHIRN